jgi:hypothetical protein
MVSMNTNANLKVSLKLGSKQSVSRANHGNVLQGI